MPSGMFPTWLRTTVLINFSIFSITAQIPPPPPGAIQQIFARPAFFHQPPPQLFVPQPQQFYQPPFSIGVRPPAPPPPSQPLPSLTLHQDLPQAKPLNAYPRPPTPNTPYLRPNSYAQPPPQQYPVAPPPQYPVAPPPPQYPVAPPPPTYALPPPPPPPPQYVLPPRPQQYAVAHTYVLPPPQYILPPPVYVVPPPVYITTPPPPKCTANRFGLLCCSSKLFQLMEELMSQPQNAARWGKCNMQKQATDMKVAVEQVFDHSFEAVISPSELANKSRFKGDLYCKTKSPDGKIVLLYAPPAQYTTGDGPSRPLTEAEIAAKGWTDKDNEITEI